MSHLLPKDRFPRELGWYSIKMEIATLILAMFWKTRRVLCMAPKFPTAGKPMEEILEQEEVYFRPRFCSVTHRHRGSWRRCGLCNGGDCPSLCGGDGGSNSAGAASSSALTNSCLGLSLLTIGSRWLICKKEISCSAKMSPNKDKSVGLSPLIQSGQ